MSGEIRKRLQKKFGFQMGQRKDGIRTTHSRSERWDREAKQYFRKGAKKTAAQQGSKKKRIFQETFGFFFYQMFPSSRGSLFCYKDATRGVLFSVVYPSHPYAEMKSEDMIKLKENASLCRWYPDVWEYKDKASRPFFRPWKANEFFSHMLNESNEASSSSDHENVAITGEEKCA